MNVIVALRGESGGYNRIAVRYRLSPIVALRGESGGYNWWK